MVCNCLESYNPPVLDAPMIYPLSLSNLHYWAGSSGCHRVQIINYVLESLCAMQTCPDSTALYLDPAPQLIPT